MTVHVPTADAVETMMLAIGQRARAAAKAVRDAPRSARTFALKAMAARIRAAAPQILAANAADLERGRRDGLSAPMMDRLALDAGRLEAIAAGVDAIAAQDEPLGEVIADWIRPNGLRIQRVRIPVGVIGIIYESRPNVTADAGALCIRSGNCVILRGGSDAIDSSTALTNALRLGLEDAGLPGDAIQLVPTTDRAAVGSLLRGLGGSVDLIVPRGGKSLVARVQEEARVPVLAHLEGLCHTYIHTGADHAKAIALTVNAKMRRTGICGATETLLLDRSIAAQILPVIAAELTARGCELRGDDAARAIVPMAVATEEDWRTEYLAPILAVRVVDGIEAAIAHIATYGSGHTDCIVTEDTGAAEQFLHEVDSAIVLVNASTQLPMAASSGSEQRSGLVPGGCMPEDPSEPRG